FAVGSRQKAVGSECVSVPPTLAGGSGKTDVKVRALHLLANEGEFEVSAFGLRMGAGKTAKWLRELEQEGLIERSYRTRSTVTRAKRRRAVRLIKSAATALPTEDLGETKAQQR